MFKKQSYSFFFTIFTTCFLWWAIELNFGVFTGIDGLGFLAHKSCIEYVDQRGIFDFINLKVLCTYQSYLDVSTYEKDFLKVFVNLGLIHLLVASGTHLLIIQSGARWIAKPFTSSQWPIYFILFGFVLISNFCIPVGRCFVQLMVSRLSQKHSLSWSHINTTILGSLIYLLFFPSAVLTISFWLSLSASLCLATLSKDTLFLSLVFFFGLIPFIYDFGQPSISAILINILITPLLGPFLIWNSMLYILIPPYTPLSDWLMIHIFSFLKEFSFFAYESSAPNYKPTVFSKIIYGILFCVICFMFQFFRSQSLKRKIKNEH